MEDLKVLLESEMASISRGLSDVIQHNIKSYHRCVNVTVRIQPHPEAVEYKCGFHVTKEWLECSDACPTDLLDTFINRILLDVGYAITDSSLEIETGDNKPRMNNLLGLQDGVTKLRRLGASSNEVFFKFGSCEIEDGNLLTVFFQLKVT